MALSRGRGAADGEGLRLLAFKGASRPEGTWDEVSYVTDAGFGAGKIFDFGSPISSEAPGMNHKLLRLELAARTLESARSRVAQFAFGSARQPWETSTMSLRFAEVAKRLGEDATEQFSESWPKLTAGNGGRL